MYHEKVQQYNVLNIKKKLLKCIHTVAFHGGHPLTDYTLLLFQNLLHFLVASLIGNRLNILKKNWSEKQHTHTHNAVTN
jgi:hypothetical protein